MKRTGRPRVDADDESINVHLQLPARQYDRLYQQAERDQISIPELIRRKLHDHKLPPNK
jgi:hypothetical protein